MDWDKLRVFHAVAEAGSFTHAGESLNLSQSAVSRQISALEESLSVPLFHRHARGLILTEQGELLFRTAREVFAKLAMAEGLISESKDRPKGPLKITTTVAFGSTWLTPRIREFLDLYPEIQVTMVIDDTELDLSMREADVAIRMSPPRQPDLIQRHLVSVPTHVYAAPDYIKKHGMPQQPEDLDKHRLIVYGEDARPPVQNVNWLLEAGAKPGQERKPILAVNNFYAMLRAVISGLGIAAHAGFHRHRAHRSGARAAGADRAADRSLFRLSRRTADLEADQRVPRFPAAQGRRNPAQLIRSNPHLGKSIWRHIRGLRFLQTSQNKFPVVEPRRIVHLRTRDGTSHEVFGGFPPIRVPGICPGKRVFGPLRLPDVKPPCSNLAPASPGPFFFRD